MSDESEDDLPGFGREEFNPFANLPVGADGLNGYGRMMRNNHYHNIREAIRLGESLDVFSLGRSRAELLRAMLKGEFRDSKP